MLLAIYWWEEIVNKNVAYQETLMYVYTVLPVATQHYCGYASASFLELLQQIIQSVYLYFRPGSTPDALLDTALPFYPGSEQVLSVNSLAAVLVLCLGIKHQL